MPEFIINITKFWKTLCLTIKKTWTYFTAYPGKNKNYGTKTNYIT